MGRPRKPDEDRDDTVSVTFRWPRDLRAGLSKAADADERSLNLYVVRVLRAHLESLEAERDAPAGRKGK